MFANAETFRIKQVAEMTGISRQTLISWERRHGILTPMRTANGYRHYSRADLEVLERIQNLLAQGHRIGDVARILRTDRGPTQDVDSGLGALQRQLGEALRAFDAQRVHTLSSRLATVSFRDRVDGVYLPMLHWIGALWERGEATVAEEHYVSAYCRTQMLTMLSALDSGRKSGRRVLAAGFPGEHHENGLLAVAVKLALEGAAVTYLGASLPSVDVAQVASVIDAELVCQSVVLRRGPGQIYRHAIELREQLPPTSLLAIGGTGLPATIEAIEGVAFCRSLEELNQHARRPTAR